MTRRDLSSVGPGRRPDAQALFGLTNPKIAAEEFGLSLPVICGAEAPRCLVGTSGGVLLSAARKEMQA